MVQHRCKSPIYSAIFVDKVFNRFKITAETTNDKIMIFINRDDLRQFIENIEQLLDSSCPKCNKTLKEATGIGLFCPNQSCDMLDGPFIDQQNKKGYPWKQTTP